MIHNAPSWCPKIAAAPVGGVKKIRREDEENFIVTFARAAEALLTRGDEVESQRES